MDSSTLVPSPSSSTTSDATASVPATTPMEYTMEEIAIHNKRDDMWMVIDGGVYDLTKFFKDHPGGGDVLVMYSGIERFIFDVLIFDINSAIGQDSTSAFYAVGHSREADEMMKSYFIGYLAKKK